MHPFRVYDKGNKVTWLVLNYHPNDGSYLAVRVDDSDLDGELRTLSVTEITGLKFIDLTVQEDGR